MPYSSMNSAQHFNTIGTGVEQHTHKTDHDDEIETFMGSIIYLKMIWKYKTKKQVKETYSHVPNWANVRPGRSRKRAPSRCPTASVYGETASIRWNSCFWFLVIREPIGIKQTRLSFETKRKQEKETHRHKHEKPKQNTTCPFLIRYLFFTPFSNRLSWVIDTRHTKITNSPFFFVFSRMKMLSQGFLFKKI